ncbi:MAG TPA: DUF1844 domain-containing protein [Candidatus Ozemobacteraceae bacterium]|nr:DUF1844 domain-containing protein [Candidatus Ozemobacteraceae bacterium]
MDDSSVIKIADRRAAYLEDTEEKPAPQPAAPAAKQPTPARPASAPPAPPRPAAPVMNSSDASELSDEEISDDAASPEPPPRGAGQPRPARGGMRGPSLVSMHVVETAGFMMEILLQKAFVTMGMIPNPETGRRERDLDQTQIAIDLLTATAEQMRGRWGMPGVEQDIDAQLMSLRLQYARLAPTAADKP